MVGLITLMLMFGLYFHESPQAAEHGIRLFGWHPLVPISGVLLMLAAFIGEKYIKIEGYEDDIYHFNTMQSTFETARRALAPTAKGAEAYRKIIFDLGLKALDENSKWVILHDSMRAKPSLD